MIRADFGALLLLGCLGSIACGGAAQATLPDPPAAETRANLVASLCSDGQCRCREKEERVGGPAPGWKRFRVELGPAAQPLWVSIGQAILYKDGQRGEACFYIDLQAPGPYSVKFRAARGEGGVAARVAISELAVDDESGEERWYDSYRFDCGAPGFCSRSSIEAETDRLRRAGHRHDPCGSVQVRSTTWRSGPTSNGVHPTDLLVEAELELYKFIPRHPSGSAACAKDGGDQD